MSDTTMRAALLDEYGGPLSYGRSLSPTPGPGRLLVVATNEGTHGCTGLRPVHRPTGLAIQAMLFGQVQPRLGLETL